MIKRNLNKDEITTIWSALTLLEAKRKGDLMRVEINKEIKPNFKEDKVITRHLKQSIKITRKLIDELEQIRFKAK